MPANAKLATTLEAAADLALGRTPSAATTTTVTIPARGKFIRGLYAGGTLCAEAQVILASAGLACASNAPVPGSKTLTADFIGHTLIDLGDDEYTQGRPHPMIEPSVRDEPLSDALADPDVAVVLLDLVLGHGASNDPAGPIIRLLEIVPRRQLHIIASVTGTKLDPQDRAAQRSKLDGAGVVVAQSNAEAVRLAIRYICG